MTQTLTIVDLDKPSATIHVALSNDLLRYLFTITYGSLVV